MTGELYVGHDGKGHRVYRTVLGLHPVWVGPPFAEPKDAIAYAQRLRGVPSVQATRSAQHDSVREEDALGEGPAAPFGSPEPDPSIPGSGDLSLGL